MIAPTTLRFLWLAVALGATACSRKPAQGTPQTAPAPVPTSAALPAPHETSAQAFQRRQREVRSTAEKRLAEAREALAADRKGSDEVSAELRRRLGSRRIDIATRTGRIYPHATILESTISDVTFEADGTRVTLPWDLVSPASLLAASALIYEGGSGVQQFERGRFLMARRLWQDARDAFEAAGKLDGSLKSRLFSVREPLENVISGRGKHGGRVERRGHDELAITYDFATKDELVDFEGNFAYVVGARPGVALRGGTVTHAVEFSGSMSVRMKVRPTGSVIVGLFCTRDGGYAIGLGPRGAGLIKFDAEYTPKPIKQTQEIFIEPGRLHDLVISAENNRISVHVDGTRSWQTELPAGSRSGTLIVTAPEEAVLVAPLVISGRVERPVLEKYMEHVEVLARRAADPELRDIAERRKQDDPQQLFGAPSGTTLSAEDPHLLGGMARDPQAYEEVKSSLLAMLQKDAGEDATLRKLNEVTRQHPDVAAVWYLRALYWTHHQDWAAADGSLRTALALYPEFAEALTLLAAVREANSDSAAALEISSRAVAARPDYAPAYVIRAIAGFACDPAAVDRAMDDALLALKLQPRNTEAAIIARALRYQARGPRDLGCRFEHETPHYRIVTDISDEAARLYGNRLEAARGYFSTVFPGPAAAAVGRKPRVAIFNTIESFLTYFELLSERRAQFVVGVFMKRWNELVLYESANRDETLGTLYHEAFHHYVTLLSRYTPPFWFNEGLAEYMSGIEVKDDKVVESGRVLRGRLHDLRSGTAASFDSIMCQTPREFYSGNASYKYAQSWSMLHFLHHHDNGRYRDLVRRYLDSVRDGKTTTECFDAVFSERASAIQKEWADYVKKLK